MPDERDTIVVRNVPQHKKRRSQQEIKQVRDRKWETTLT